MFTWNFVPSSWILAEYNTHHGQEIGMQYNTKQNPSYNSSLWTVKGELRKSFAATSTTHDDSYLLHLNIPSVLCYMDFRFTLSMWVDD